MDLSWVEVAVIRILLASMKSNITYTVDVITNEKIRRINIAFFNLRLSSSLLTRLLATILSSQAFCALDLFLAASRAAAFSSFVIRWAFVFWGLADFAGFSPTFSALPISAVSFSIGLRFSLISSVIVSCFDTMCHYLTQSVMNWLAP